MGLCLEIRQTEPYGNVRGVFEYNIKINSKEVE
jgi:hypothetical protein